MVRIVALIIFALLMLWLGPIAAIWSVNTLFSMAIPYTFDTWCASLILSAAVSGQSFISFKA